MKKLLLPALFLVPAHAATAPTSASGLNLMGGAQSVSAPMQVVILMTVLTMLPAVVMCVTPFLRITVVLHFLRQALGTQSTPSNQVLLGLALFLTILVMQPVAIDVYFAGRVGADGAGQAHDHRGIHRRLEAPRNFSAAVRPREGYSTLPQRYLHKAPRRGHRKTWISRCWLPLTSSPN